MMRIEQIGQRVYVMDSPYGLKDRLKAAGCHWDGELRAWWIGAAKRAAIEAIVSAPPPAPMTDEGLARDRDRILGRCRYTGQSGKPGSYYVVWHGQTAKGAAYRLMLRDGSKDLLRRRREGVGGDDVREAPDAPRPAGVRGAQEARTRDRRVLLLLPPIGLVYLPPQRLPHPLRRLRQVRLRKRRMTGMRIAEHARAAYTRARTALRAARQARAGGDPMEARRQVRLAAEARAWGRAWARVALREAEGR